jgi:hypothetical protein
MYYAADSQADRFPDDQVGGAIDQPDIEVVRMILDQGGDPNEAICGMTVWHRYLLLLDKLGEGVTLGESLKRQKDADWQIWIDVTELLVRYGAAWVVEWDASPIAAIHPFRSTRGRLRKVSAWLSVFRAFGDKEADRLQEISNWLQLTGQNLLTKVTRNLWSFWSEIY